MAKSKNKGWRQEEAPENIEACLSCKRPRCSGEAYCMQRRKKEMLERREKNDI